jgi:hypothetical protein
MIISDELKNVISEIENSNNQKIKRSSKTEVFKLKPDPLLTSNLSGNYGALFVRSMLRKLNINEHHVFKWRPENKFRQYEIFSYYIPGCMPQTLSFSKLLKQPDGVQQIKELFSEGFFLKATLGDASFSTNSWDKTAEFDQISKLHNVNSNNYESYMLQKKLDLKCEFRIHTFCKDVIPCLTFLVQSQILSSNYAGVEKFLNEILRKLPDGILQGTLIAWDIGLTSNDKYFVIEANFTGYHPEYRTGFQTTGYVDDNHFGPIICAWLNNYFNVKYGIHVDSVEKSLLESNPFYQSFIFYISIFKNAHIDIIRDKLNDSSVSAIVYLGNDTNKLIVRLIKYFLLVDYAEMYYVIAKEECLLRVRELFLRNDQIKVWGEQELFTKTQLGLVKQLSYDRRKQICSYHAIRKLNNTPYVLI